MAESQAGKSNLHRHIREEKSAKPYLFRSCGERAPCCHAHSFLTPCGRVLHFCYIPSSLQTLTYKLQLKLIRPAIIFDSWVCNYRTFICSPKKPGYYSGPAILTRLSAVPKSGLGTISGRCTIVDIELR